MNAPVFVVLRALVVTAAACFLGASVALAEVGVGESALLTVDTRWQNFEGSGLSGSFTVDTRYSGSAGEAFSGSFTVDTRGAVPGTVIGVLALYPAASYSPATLTLTLAVKGTDPLYGNVTSGSCVWSLELSGAGVVDSGSASFNSSAQQWQAGKTYGSSLTPGNYTVRYTLTSSLGRQGQAAVALAVGAATVAVNGTIRDASNQTPLSGAQVAVFAAGGANGLWTLVNASYGGVVPQLSTLLAQLTPLKPTQVTGAGGAFAWPDVPAGSSCVIVAAKSGYADANTGAFPLSATQSQTTKNLALNPQATTLAVVNNEVSSLRNKAEGLLNYHAEIAGALTAQYYEDDLYGFDQNSYYFSKVASVIGGAGDVFSGLPDGVVPASEGLFEKIGLAVAQSLAEGLPNDAINGMRVVLQNGLFPADALAYRQSSFHTTSLAALNSEYTAFSQAAPSATLGSGFSTAKAGELGQQIERQAAKVMAGSGIYVVSPAPLGPLRGFTLTNAAEAYFKWSRGLDYVEGTEKVLNVAQIAAGSVLIYGGAVAVTGVGAPVGAPVAAGAVVVNRVAKYGKKLTAAGKIVIKSKLGHDYVATICGTYPTDNESAWLTFADYVDLLEAEAAAPFYLNVNNRFRAQTAIDMNYFFEGVPVIFAWGGVPGLDVAEKEAEVTITDASTLGSGSGPLSVRCVGYTLWNPITLKSALGLGEQTILESSEAAGPATVALGGTKKFTMTYRGHSKNLLSLVAPHYFIVDTYVGPWRVSSTYEPFLVLAPGELNPWNLLHASGSPLALVDRSQLLAPVATKKGRKRTHDVQAEGARVAQVATNSLTAASASLAATVTVETNLYAINFKLFAPGETDVSLLVSDSTGRRVGYSSVSGLTYTELPATVTDQGRRPVNVRLIGPPSGETYTIEASLLSPGAEPVPVAVFAETEEISDAVLAASATLLVLDGDRGTSRDAQISYGEISGQQPLTSVTAAFTNVVKWNGSAQISCSSNAVQVLGDIPAGENRAAGWHLTFPGAAEYGKYVGTITASCDQTVPLETPVVALVRRATRTVSTFVGTNAQGSLVQTTLTIPAGGSTQTWVHMPPGYYVVHASLGLVGASTNVQNPQIDIGADGTVEWAFSGKYDLGAVANHLEDGFNRFLTNAPGSTNGVDVPVRIVANGGERIQFNGVQLYLEAHPFQLLSPEVQPGGSVSLGLVGHPATPYAIEVSTNLTDWTLLTNRVASGGSDVVVDASAPAYGMRFYRAVLE